MTAAPACDVLVIGAGGAGVMAARAAAAAGASVLLMDAGGAVGGTAATAGGGTCIAGSARQRELGIADDIGAALQDWADVGGPTADLGWAERYLRAMVGDLGRELEALGVRWGEVRWQEGNRVPRWHAPRGGGRAVMRSLEEALRDDRRIEVCLRTRLEALTARGGRIDGAVVRTADGRQREVCAGAVVLATGGFTSDPELVRRHVDPDGRYPRVLLGGGPGATGSGHRVLEPLGADFVNLDAVWMYAYGTPDHRDPSGTRGLAVRGLVGDVWVNRHGERFHDEQRRGAASATPALLQQPGAMAWSIIDAPLARRVTLADPRYRSGEVPDRAAIASWMHDAPDVQTAPDLRTLATAIDVDVAVLERTVEEERRRRRDAARTDVENTAPLLDEPPFAAIRFLPLARKNLGGVRTTTACEVLRRDGSVIGGLFAAGELAGMAGGTVNGRGALEGTMFGPCLFSGREAGTRAAGA